MIHKAIEQLIESTCQCFPGKVPQGVQPPFVNHFTVSADQGPTKDGNQVKTIRYQISVFTRDKVSGLQIGENISDILDNYRGEVGGHSIDLIRLIDENDLYEDDAEMYHRALDFQIRYR